MASYNTVHELLGLVERPVFASGISSLLAIGGASGGTLSNFIVFCLFLQSILSETDDLTTLPYSSISVRGVTDVLMMLGSGWASQWMISEFDLGRREMYGKGDTWAAWGASLIVQYLGLVNSLTTFRTILFAIIVLARLGAQVFAYFYPEP